MNATDMNAEVKDIWSQYPQAEAAGEAWTLGGLHCLV
jgi:hypothetical protein